MTAIDPPADGRAKPRYHTGGKHTDMPDSLLSKLKPYIEANPAITTEEIYQITAANGDGEILSTRELNELKEYFS